MRPVKSKNDEGTGRFRYRHAIYGKMLYKGQFGDRPHIEKPAMPEGLRTRKDSLRAYWGSGRSIRVMFDRYTSKVPGGKESRHWAFKFVRRTER